MATSRPAVNTQTHNEYESSNPMQIHTCPKKRLIIACDGTWMDSDGVEVSLTSQTSPSQIPVQTTRCPLCALKKQVADSSGTFNISQVVVYLGLDHACSHVRIFLLFPTHAGTGLLTPILASTK